MSLLKGVAQIKSKTNKAHRKLEVSMLSFFFKKT